MAQGIVDCTGKTINIGDKVRTETGDIIEVCGGMVSEHVLFNAEKCKVVGKDEKLTNTGHVEEFRKKHGQDGPLGGGPKGEKQTRSSSGDCVVWGT